MQYFLDKEKLIIDFDAEIKIYFVIFSPGMVAKPKN